MAVSDLNFIDATGYHFADFPSFLSYLTTAYQSIYGSDVYLGADSQDGQWLALVAQALFDTASVGASNYNSFSPATAQGVGLSRVVKINGLRRGIPTNSTVVVTIIGTANTVIANGVVIDTLQQKWDLPASVTIPFSGTIDVTAVSEVMGNITADPNTVTGIFTPTLGWQSVNNTDAATPGAPVELDATLRARQAVSTSLPALTVIDATIGALENLTGVTEVKSYENDTGTTDGNGLPGHSICFVVQGGLIADITNAIGLYKTPGTNTFASGPNARNETYIDPKGMPVPINFINPAITATISVEITVTPLNNGWSTDYVAQIEDALSAAIQSVPIGGTVVYTALFVAAYLVGTPAYGTFDVISIEIKKNAGSFAAANIPLNFDEIPLCDPTTDVFVTVT